MPRSRRGPRPSKGRSPRSGDRIGSPSRSLELKLSQEPFSQGLPGSMKAVFAPTAAIQSLTALAMGSFGRRPHHCPGGRGRAHPVRHEQIGQDIDHGGRVPRPVDPDRQALRGELVDDVPHPGLPSVPCPALDDIAGPDAVRALRAQAEAGPVIDPEPPLPGLLPRHRRLGRGTRPTGAFPDPPQSRRHSPSSSNRWRTGARRSPRFTITAPPASRSMAAIRR